MVNIFTRLNRFVDSVKVLWKVCIWDRKENIYTFKDSGNAKNVNINFSGSRGP